MHEEDSVPKRPHRKHLSGRGQSQISAYLRCRNTCIDDRIELFLARASEESPARSKLPSRSRAFH